MPATWQTSDRPAARRVALPGARALRRDPLRGAGEAPARDAAQQQAALSRAQRRGRRGEGAAVDPLVEVVKQPDAGGADQEGERARGTRRRAQEQQHERQRQQQHEHQQHQQHQQQHESQGQQPRLEAHEYYHAFHRLGFDQRITDGFFDAGRQEAALHSHGLAELHSERWDGRAREVLLVDREADPGLSKFEEQVFDALLDKETERERVLTLATMVAERLGGQNDPALERKFLAQLAELRERQGNGNNVVPLGVLRFGLCRHRALLFKAVADNLPLGMGVRAAVYRGVFEGDGAAGSGAHAWNAVLPDDGNPGGRLLDLLHHPNVLYERGSDKERRYRRVGHTSARGELVWSKGAVSAAPPPRSGKGHAVWQPNQEKSAVAAYYAERPLGDVYSSLAALLSTLHAEFPESREAVRQREEELQRMEERAEEEVAAEFAKLEPSTVEEWLLAERDERNTDKVGDGADWLRSSWGNVLGSAGNVDS